MSRSVQNDYDKLKNPGIPRVSGVRTEAQLRRALEINKAEADELIGKPDADPLELAAYAGIIAGLMFALGETP